MLMLAEMSLIFRTFICIAVNSPPRSRLFANPPLESLRTWKEQKNAPKCNVQKGPRPETVDSGQPRDGRLEPTALAGSFEQACSEPTAQPQLSKGESGADSVWIQGPA
ncbi:uncharacterized protein [Dipodomys merriami]|uniref:uncharacterized protein isoform X2 n=1 Tax=Dipodomys merriami TaxID=94247 RepID=UPI0038557266